MVSCGILGCFAAGTYLKRTQAFKFASKVSAIAHFISIAGFILCLEFYPNKIITAVWIGLIGFFNIMV